MSSAKRRRSERIDTRVRMLLEILHPVPIKEIIVTQEVSWHGAKILARRKLQKESRGIIHTIPETREAPCRVVWQDSKTDAEGRMATGIEIYPNTNFWGMTFRGGEVGDSRIVQPAAGPPPPRAATPAAQDASAILAQMTGQGSDSAQSLLILWSGLIQTLEENGVISREDLITVLKTMGK